MYFPTAELLSQCIKALNGREWKGRTLVATFMNSSAATCLCVRRIPSLWTESEIHKTFQEVLGDIPYKEIRWNQRLDENFLHRNIFIQFFSEEHTDIARTKLIEAGFNVEDSRSYAMR